MDIRICFSLGGSRKSGLDHQSYNANKWKKQGEGNLKDLHVLKSSLLGDVFGSRFEAPKCVKILSNYINNVENQMKELMDLVNATQTS